MLIRNPRARYDYELLETYEAGLALKGSEVKALRGGGGSIGEAFGRFSDGEIFLEGMHIPEYTQASYNNHAPVRPRKLLLHKDQIRRIQKGIERQGLTLIPIQLHFRNGWAKIRIALARGRKKYDKREREAKRDAQMQIDRAVKGTR